MPVSKHWYMSDARTRTGSNVSKPFFPTGFFTLPCREWFSVHPPYGVWEGTSHPIYWKKLYVLDCPQAQHRPCSGLAMALRPRLCLQRTPARLLRNSHQGLSWPRKATQDATGEELAAAWPWNFERASLWAPVLKWGCLAKHFSSTEKFCLLQTLARCLGGTGWTWNKLLAAWKVYFGGFGIYLLPLHSRLVLSKFNSTTCLNHQNKLSSSPKVLFHGSLPSTCPKTAHTP